MELNRIIRELIENIDDLLLRLNCENFLKEESKSLFSLLDKLESLGKDYSEELKKLDINSSEIQLYVSKCQDYIKTKKLNQYGKFDVIRTSLYFIKLELERK